MAESLRQLNVTLDTSAAQAYARALQQAPALLEEELSASLTEATMLLEAEVKDRTPVAVTSALRGSIASEVRGEGADLSGVVFSPLSYAAPVELGTRPHWAPLEPLALWAEKKLGVSAEEANDVGRRVQLKIAARGTQGQFMFSQALDAARGNITRFIEQGMARLRSRLAGIRD